MTHLSMVATTLLAIFAQQWTLYPFPYQVDNYYTGLHLGNSTAMPIWLVGDNIFDVSTVLSLQLGCNIELATSTNVPA